MYTNDLVHTLLQFFSNLGHRGAHAPSTSAPVFAITVQECATTTIVVTCKTQAYS